MTGIDERTAANMRVVLEQVCRDLPHGGDHESRKHIAKTSAKREKRKRYAGWIAYRGQSCPFRVIQPQIGLMPKTRRSEES
jgi:hypothetical protein